MQSTFKFTFETYNGTRAIASQNSFIEEFSYLGFQGPICMRNPDQTFAILENYDVERGVPIEIFFGRLVSRSSRDLVKTLDLKKRCYIGTTSMDSELALVTANIARVRPASLVLDPFAGTGSFMIAASIFGASTFGSDIDGRQLRGKKGRNVAANFRQYNLQSRLMDCFICDMTNFPLCERQIFDSIICDRMVVNYEC